MNNLKTPEQVKELMQSSRSGQEWDDNCDKVKAANDGYPDFWYSTIILSGSAGANIKDLINPRMNLPEHKCGLFLNHNEHRNYYMTAVDYIKEWEAQPCPPDWKDENAKRRAVETDEIWELQWYPDTPIGFNRVAAPTLREVLELAKDATKDS